MKGISALLAMAVLLLSARADEIAAHGAADLPGPATSELIAEAQEELHQDTLLLSSVAQELNRLQSLWKRMSEGNGATMRSRQQLQSEITEIQRGLSALMVNLNDTQRDLDAAHVEIKEKEELEELISQIKGGKIGVNYETGELTGNLTRRLWSGAHLPEEVTRLATEGDPAVLHLDAHLLQDIVVLSVAVAAGGFLASISRLPPTCGFILSGMLVGPSGLNLIGNIVQVETLASMGSIFLLFCHGMMYSQHYHLPSLGGVMPETFAAGVLILSTVFFTTILLWMLWAGPGEIYQATLVASAISLSSTTTTALTLTHCKLRETSYGKAMGELMAVQDLLMAPLLSLPTAMKELLFHYGLVYMLPILGFYASALAGAAFVSQRLMPKMFSLRTRGENSLSLELFMLGLVSYCLCMSLLTEWMGLSHECGALLAGLVLTDVPSVGKAVTVIEPLTCLFGGMYLGSLGMILSPVFLMNHAQYLAICVALVLVIKMGAVFVGLRLLGYTMAASAVGGFSLAQISELSLFLVARAQEYDLISRPVYLLVVATTVMLLILTPLSAHAFRAVDRSRYKALPGKSPFSRWWGPKDRLGSGDEGEHRVP